MKIMSKEEFLRNELMKKDKETIIDLYLQLKFDIGANIEILREENNKLAEIALYKKLKKEI